MSDYADDDDMDVEFDAPNKALADHTVLFGADAATKGKRSAANLPVEAEDSLPWYVIVFLTE
jgi:replication factor C subunit 3/5